MTDRERLAQRLEGWREGGTAESQRQLAADMLEAAAALRLPVPEECEAMAERLTEWRDIASAPKTTRAILVHCPERQNTYAVSWDDLQGCWAYFGGSHRELMEEPTKWMPLPLPPVEDKP